jgi:hypothetical protein
MMAKSRLFIGIILLSIVTIFGGACAQQQPTPTPPRVYSIPELKYLLLASFDNVFYVDPDFYPIAREGQEEKNALEQFPIIRANAVEFSAILEHLGMPNKGEYTNEEKLRIYREHKKLTLGVELTASGDIYHFILRVEEGQGERIEGTITPSGEIKVLKREPSFNTYPICLTKGTLIDTPSGPVPVEQLHRGMAIWTVDNSGNRIVAGVVETTTTAEGRALGEYHVGDTLDGALVILVQHVIYNGGATYDLLPAGSTGLYWANGILLKSTLAAN